MTAMPEFERARLDVLAYFLHDDRDTDGGAKAIDDLAFPKLVAIVDAVIRGLTTDPSVAYALAWADAGGTAPGPLVGIATEAAAYLANLAHTNNTRLGHLLDSAELVDLAGRLRSAAGRDELTDMAPMPTEVVFRDPPMPPTIDALDPAALVVPLALDLAHLAFTRLRGGLVKDSTLYDAAEKVERLARPLVITGLDASDSWPPDAIPVPRRLLADAAIMLTDEHAASPLGRDGTGDLLLRYAKLPAPTAGEKPMPDPEVIPVRRSDLVELLVVHHDHERPATLGAIDRLMAAAGVEGSVGDFLDETAQHTPPEVRAPRSEGFGDAEGPLDPYEVVTEAARWVRARLGSASGVPVVEGSYDALSGIKAADDLDRFGRMMSEGRPALVDDVHRLAEAGGRLAKATDQLRAQALDLDAGDSERRWAVSAVAMGRIDQARESWGHAVRGVYAVPHPRFVERARGVAIAAGELGGYVTEAVEGGLSDRLDAEVLARQAKTLGDALTAFDEVDTAYQRDRDEHARRIRLSD